MDKYIEEFDDFLRKCFIQVTIHLGTFNCIEKTLSVNNNGIQINTDIGDFFSF